MRLALRSVALAFKFKRSVGRKFSAKSHSGHRRQRARPRSLCASNRTLQTTQPSSPAHPAAHTSSSARDSPDTLSLMLPGVESLGSTCALMGEPSTAEFLQSEHRNHRSLSPTDGTHLARAKSSRARSGSSLRVTPVRRGAYGWLVERSERSESHLRSRVRRSGDQGHRGRCPADQSRPWGRIRGTRGAIDSLVCKK